MSELRALSFEIQNVEGIANAQLNFGKRKAGEGALYLIDGANGAGKSSVLHGIAALSAAAHDPSILRDGAEKSIVKMTYWDGESAAEVSREIMPLEKGKLTVKGDVPGVPAKQLETWIKGLMGVGFGQNPLEFLCPNGKKPDAAKRKERLDYLMKVLDISFGLDEVKRALNGAESQLVTTDRPRASLDLPGINKLSRDLVAIRGPLSTRRDDRVAAAETFRRSLAAKEQGEAPKNWKAELAQLAKQQDAIRRDESEEVDLIQAQLRDVRRRLDNTRSLADDNANSMWSTLLAEVRSAHNPLIVDGKTDATRVNRIVMALLELASIHRQINTAEDDARKAVEKSRASHAEQLQSLAADIATAQAGADEQIRTSGIREQMEECQKQAAELSATWDQIDAAVKNIEALKKSKLAQLPEALAGLQVGDDDDIYINGRQFDKWNRAEQYIWALRIGSIGTGELNMLICDEAEHLDDENLDKVRKGIVKSGLVVIMARCSKGGPLRRTPSDFLKVA